MGRPDLAMKTSSRYAPDALSPGETPRSHLERLRSAEFELVAGWFEPGSHVLELGAGSGYQASLLTARGCHVTALDIPGRPPHEKMYYQVDDYDGCTIPLSDQSVDAVFSSHVLEHIDPHAPLLAEIRRVMKPSGVAVHVLPSTTWRIWTSIMHYPFVLKTLVLGRRADSLVSVASPKDAIRRHGVFGAIFKSAIHPLVAHGSSSNAVAEVWAFRRKRWITLFTRSGFLVVSSLPSKLFYTGYGVFSDMTLEKRRHLSSFLGSASHVFVLRKSTL
jgi:SAM-dependent methyltransferase